MNRDVCFVGLVFILSLGLHSCKSNITAADLRKQQSKAITDLVSAKEEMKNHRDAQMKELESRQKQINGDIKKLKGVETIGAQAGAENIANDLESQDTQIQRDLNNLEKMQREDWSAMRDSIDRQIATLETQIRSVTRNMPTE
jgi:TolA-binding protein